jgi:hypothetical protein
MVHSREAEGQGWNFMVSRNRMALYLKQAAMAELGVRCDVSRWDHYASWYACIEEHLNHLLGWVASSPRGKLSIDSVVSIMGGQRLLGC